MSLDVGAHFFVQHWKLSASSVIHNGVMTFNHPRICLFDALFYWSMECEHKFNFLEISISSSVHLQLVTVPSDAEDKSFDFSSHFLAASTVLVYSYQHQNA